MAFSGTRVPGNHPLPDENGNITYFARCDECDAEIPTQAAAVIVDDNVYCDEFCHSASLEH